MGGKKKGFGAIAQAAFNPVGAATQAAGGGTLGNLATSNTGAFITGEVAGAAGDVAQGMKDAQEAQKQAQKAAKAEQDRLLGAAREQQAQESAEASQASETAQRLARQRSRATGTGRASTILTSGLQSSSAERKTLLGQ